MLLVWTLALVAFSIWFSVQRFGTAVTPVVACLSAWLLSVAAYSSGVVNLHRLEIEEVVLLGVGLSSFVAGSFVASVAIPGRAVEATRRPFSPWVLFGIAGVAFAGFAYLLYALSRKVNLVVYLVAPEWVEQLGFQMPVIGYLNLLHIVLPAAFVVQGRRSRRGRGLWYAMAVASLLTTPFAGIKSYFTQSLLCMGLAALFDAGRRANALVFRSGVVMLAIFVGYFVFYDFYFKDNTRDYIGSGIVDLPREMEGLSRPLIYLTGPISTFGPFVRFEEETYYGRATLRGASKLAGRFEPVTIPPHNARRYAIPTDFNTYTGFREAYEDLRDAGMVLFPFLIGWFIHLVYARMRACPSVPLVALTAYLTMTQVLSPFGGFLTRPMSVYFLAVFLGLHVLTVSRREESSSPAGGRDHGPGSIPAIPSS